MWIVVRDGATNGWGCGYQSPHQRRCSYHGASFSRSPDPESYTWYFRHLRGCFALSNGLVWSGKYPTNYSPYDHPADVDSTK